MKSKFLLLALAFSFPVFTQAADTYFNVLMSTSGPVYVDIPSNTLAKIENAFFVNSCGYLLEGTTNETGIDYSYSGFVGSSFVGPGKIKFAKSYASNQAWVLMKFSPVNVPAKVEGYAVKPAALAATVQLESSPDLQTWTAAENGACGDTNAAIFYRVRLDLK